MAGVAVGGHYNFKTPAPQLLRQPDANLMGRRRRDLIRFERLIAVVAHPPPGLPHSRFVSHELCGRGVLPGSSGRTHRTGAPFSSLSAAYSTTLSTAWRAASSGKPASVVFSGFRT